MISDEELIGALRDEAARRVTPFRIRDLRPGSGEVDLEISTMPRKSVRLRIGLPSSTKPQPWIYRPAEDAADWIEQLMIWIEEEVRTGGMSSRRARDKDGDSEYVIVESYGWRRSNPDAHQRLLDPQS